MSSTSSSRRYSLSQLIAGGIPVSSTPLLRKDGVAKSLEVIRKSSTEEAKRKSSLIITQTQAEQTARTVDLGDGSDSETIDDDRTLVRSEQKNP
ncbi:hypothetical protein AAVH_18543 [Aphelenchoides avenae]|nr:hypothetical protein AAVH_18543 [Aphelenchus avenae]